MTYNQALQNGYGQQIEAISNIQADYTGRLMPDSAVVECSASHCFVGADGFDYTITAYYYQDGDALKACEDGDLGSLDWVAVKYEIS